MYILQKKHFIELSVECFRDFIFMNYIMCIKLDKLFQRKRKKFLIQKSI